MSENKLTNHHWDLTHDESNIAWLTIDRQDTSVNTLNEEVMRELAHIIDYLEQHIPEALVIQSAKKTGFIVGADIEQFQKIKTAEEATQLIRSGQDIFNKLSALKCPTIALIKGFCLGGGLELALACRYRIAIDTKETRLGLPEVKLGIHPGWGGTIRLPQLIGAPKAMDLILTGRMLRAKPAQKMGLINAAVPERLAMEAIKHFALNPPKLKKSKLIMMTNSSLIRPLLGKMFYRQLNKKIKREHYPAPFKVVDNWIEQGVDSKQAYIQEAQSIGQLIVTPTARHLVKIFFLQERLKNLGKKSNFKLQHVHVIGAGTMGGDIAAWCAIKGYQVTLQDQKPEWIGPAIKRAHQLAKKRLKAPHEITQALDRLMPDVLGEGIEKADVIIEAVTEKLEIKQQLFAQLEARAKPNALLATNTSTIPLEEIALSLKNSSRLVGIHFFNPVSMMPLVEVIYSKNTEEKIIHQASAFVKQIDKLPIPVKSSPGFLVNRILLPYMLEAVTLLEEGVSGPMIDKAAVEFGMPMGPIELADVVGLDICLAALEKLSGHLGTPVPIQLKSLVEQKRLGKKTNHGFYEYKNGKPQKGKLPKNVVIPKDIIDRLSLRMVNEAVACLREEIVSDGDLLDAGAVFGFGFPPFRGGPIQYIHTEGLIKLKDQLNTLEKRYGQRFIKDKGWDELSVA